MKTQLFIITLFFTFSICNAQNLVPNPSFESYNICPDTTGQILRCTHWYGYGVPLPTYFNNCSISLLCNVPSNLPGYQFAATGNAYLGFLSFNPMLQGREYLGSTLIQSLQIGQTYYVSFKVALSENNYVATNKLGVRFSTQPYSIYYPPTNNFAHVFTNNVITDSINWTVIKGSFTADSNYSTILLGNFFDDAHTQITGFGFSYYFVDDICVSTDSLICYSLVGIKEVNDNDKLTLFPNPFTDKINIAVTTNEIVIINLFDFTGRKIFNQSFTNTTSINTKLLTQGIYLYELSNQAGVLKKGKVIKE